MKALLLSFIFSALSPFGIAGNPVVLPNGCFIHSTVFAAQHNGKIVVIKYNGVNHAVAVYQDGKKTLGHDFMIGDFSIKGDVQDSFDTKMARLQAVGKPMTVVRIPADHALEEAVKILATVNIPAKIVNGRVWWKISAKEWGGYEPKTGTSRISFLTEVTLDEAVSALGQK